MNSQKPAEPGMIQIAMTPQQLDVIMATIEGTFDSAGPGHRRTQRHLAAAVDKGARDWHPGYDYSDFGVDTVVLAPVYRQMLDAWQRVGIELGTGNEFKNVFEFVDAVKVARAAAGEEVSRG